jgi:sec-independent protein translocase protein TatA
MNLGLPEILLIVTVALLFFGPSRLPGLGKSIGEAIRGFKKGMTDNEEIDAQSRKEEPKEKLSNPSQNKPSYHTDNEVEKDSEKSPDKETDKKKV